MRIPHLLQHADIIKLDIQILIHGFQGAFDADVVLELNDDFLVDQCFEETMPQGSACGIGY